MEALTVFPTMIIMCCGLRLLDIGDSPRKYLITNTMAGILLIAAMFMWVAIDIYTTPPTVPAETEEK